MKKTVKIVIICMVVLGIQITLTAAEYSQDLFRQANQLYEKGNFSEALKIYEELSRTTSHWKLFYNIGNCHFKMDQPVQAKINYLRARRLKPFEYSIQKNIEIVDKHLKDKISPRKPDFIERMMLKIESVVSLNVLSITVLVVIIILNVFIFILIKKGKSRLILYGVSFSLIVFILFSGYLYYRVEKYNRRDTAVIIEEDAQFRSGPGENNTILFKVHPGLEVKIIDHSVNRKWFQVSASSEIAGWIEAESLELI